MATIKDIAHIAGVSPTTVSRVLSQDETLSVSQEVRLKILRTAHELKYVSPRVRHMQEKEKLVIGIADWQIIRQDRKNIRIASLNTIMGAMLKKIDVQFVRMEKNKPGRYDGIIALGIFSPEEMEQLKLQSIAIVFINSDDKNYEYDSIIMDFNRGIEEAFEYLLYKRQYRTIGYIGGLFNDGNIRIGYKRLESVKTLLQQYHCLEERNLFVGEFSKEGGCAMAKKAIESGHLPEAMLLGSDEIAEGAIEVFQEAGLRIPKDIAVVIYEDIKTLESKWQEYTHISMFPDIVWETAIKLLLEQIREHRVESMKILLPGKLVMGESA